MKDSIYFKQADLLLEILPLIDLDRDFAIKGGTAINFFVRNLPRLSIDIDLCYLPLRTREFSLNDIDHKLRELRARIEDRFKNSRATLKQNENKIIGYIFNIGGFSVKIEINPVMRGTVFKPEVRTLVEKAGEYFEKFVEAQILSMADLYGGKICAALDRQHPRDIFDVKLLLGNEGITEEIKQAFIIYLLSHPRPIIELLNPGLKDLSEIFANEFEGMTLESITLDQLLATRKSLINEINYSISREDRRFIASFKNKKPDWQLFPLSHVWKLPAIQWKLLNLRRMDKAKHREAFFKLLDFLEIEPGEIG